MIVAISLLSTKISATERYSGFSYVGFGIETTTYQETHVKDDVTYKTSATSSAPVYTSGSLINVGKYFDFSIDATSTLMATTSDEAVQNTETSIIVQENKYDSVQSDLKFLLHYKMNNNHRVVLGANYNMFTMKRHTFVYPGTNEQIPGTELNQEDIATLNIMVGYWYESAPFSNDGMRVSVSALYGKPIWNKATNTSSEELEFSSTVGSTLNANAYLGFELIRGLEIGMFGSYSLKNKDEANTETVNSKDTTWPKNELETFRYGLNLVWNFDVK
jgi:hypothetical protein